LGVEQQKITLRLTKIHCNRTTSGVGDDDIFFKISEQRDDDLFYTIGTWFYENPIHMKSKDSMDDTYVDIDIDATYQRSIRVYIWEKDKNDSMRIGSTTFTRDDLLEGDRTITGEGASYRLSYRVINKPIQTLRILGIRCEHDSDGCNSEVVDAVCEAASLAAEEASKVIAKSPRPRAKAVAEAFDVASSILGEISGVIIWAANVAEGADEVYMQHVDAEGHQIQGGGFWPENAPYHQMVSGDSVHFTNDEGAAEVHYYRIPMDEGPVTIQLREKDPHKTDASIGVFTFDEAYYSTYADEGSQVVIADQYFRDGHGQGALYQLCISVGMENWANNPTVDSQGG